MDDFKEDINKFLSLVKKRLYEKGYIEVYSELLDGLIKQGYNINRSTIGAENILCLAQKLGDD